MAGRRRMIHCKYRDSDVITALFYCEEGSQYPQNQHKLTCTHSSACNYPPYQPMSPGPSVHRHIGDPPMRKRLEGEEEILGEGEGVTNQVGVEGVTFGQRVHYSMAA